MHWDDYPGVGQVLCVIFNITNNRNSSIEVEAVSISQPKGWQIIANVRQAVDVMYGKGRKLETVDSLPIPMRLARKDADLSNFDRGLLPSRVEERIYVLPPEGFSPGRSASSLSIKIRCSRNSFPIFRTFVTVKYSIPQHTIDRSDESIAETASEGG